jgi:hypothetical protein
MSIHGWKQLQITEVEGSLTESYETESWKEPKFVEL